MELRPRTAMKENGASSA